MAEPRVPDLLTLHANARPEKLAVVDDRPGVPLTRWSYAELNARSNRLANRMLALGVRPRDRVIWCGMNSPEVVAVTHAARKIGATAVPLNYRLAPEEAAYVVDNSDAVFAWVDADQAELFAGIRAEIGKVREVAIYGGAPAPGQLAAASWLDEGDASEPEAPDAGEASTMIYTSGTTGHPKGAVRRGSGDPEQLRALIALIGYQPEDVYLSTGPLYHSGPGGFMAIAFALGNSVVLQRKFDPEDWLRLLETWRVTTTFSAPTPIRMVCNLPAERQGALRPQQHEAPDRERRALVLRAQAGLSGRLPRRLALRGVRLDGAGREHDPRAEGPAPQARLLRAALARRRSEARRRRGPHGHPPPPPGELFVRSKSVFATYHKAQEKYEAERRGEFHTVGDVAYFDEEGYLFICDRKKDMIISGGMNIYPAEIEAAIESHPDVYDVAVIGIPSEEWGESVHAIVVPQPGRTLAPEAVIAYAREHLAGYKIPRSVSFLPELPRTGSGKILKRVLREPFWQGQDRRV